MIEIKDIDSARIQEFNSLRSKNILEAGHFIADSEKVVDLLLSSNIEITKVLGQQKVLESRDFQSETELLYAEPSLLKQIVGHNLHHGLMAMGKIPPPVSLNNLGNNIVILNGVTSPENVGTILRTCRALNIDSLIIDHKTVHPYSRRCVRVSMGNVFDLKIHHTRVLEETLFKLKTMGHHVHSAAKNSQAVNYSDHTWAPKNAIIFGSEGHGIDVQLIKESDTVIQVPINQNVDSLNVASAAAILLADLSSKHKLF